MIKISVAELQQLLKLVERTSQDMHLIVREEGPTLTVQFQNVEGQISTVKIYDEAQQTYAKVSSTEQLSITVGRLK